MLLWGKILEKLVNSHFASTCGERMKGHTRVQLMCEEKRGVEEKICGEREKSRKVEIENRRKKERNIERAKKKKEKEERSEAERKG